MHNKVRPIRYTQVYISASNGNLETHSASPDLPVLRSSLLRRSSRGYEGWTTKDESRLRFGAGGLKVFKHGYVLMVGGTGFEPVTPAM